MNVPPQTTPNTRIDIQLAKVGSGPGEGAVGSPLNLETWRNLMGLTFVLVIAFLITALAVILFARVSKKKAEI